MITHNSRQSDPTKNAQALAVEIQGSTITVRGGDFVIDGVARTLIGDWTFDVAARAEATSLRALLAVDRGDGAVKVIVDETLPGERPARFEELPQYQFLSVIYHATIPGGATLPGDAQITCYRFVAPTKE